jgi:hypothetical protein
MSRDRDRQAIAQVACPRCQSPAGRPCVDLGWHLLGRSRPMAHTERRRAWQQARAGIEADLVMADHVDGPPGARTWTGILLTPITPRGRAAVPARRRVPTAAVRATLAGLRRQGLVIRREREEP